MSSTPVPRKSTGRAESAFREAFERLKRGRPMHLPKGSKLTQNNVAKEAGVDPSALRRSRFPELVGEIQQWIELNGSGTVTPRQRILAKRARNRSVREQLDDARAQLSDAQSRLLDLSAAYVAAVLELEKLRAKLPTGAVTRLWPKGADS